MGIRHVGETVAKKLAKAFFSLEQLKQATLESLVAVEDVGERIAQSVFSYMRDPKNEPILKQLKVAGLNLELNEMAEMTGSKLAHQKIVVSGVFERYSRDEIKQLIERNGGKLWAASHQKQT